MKNGRLTSVLLIVCVGSLAVLHFLLVFRININWDEFRYLATIYEHVRGELRSVLQTLHVHPFRWLTHFGGNEISQIIAARLVYWALLLGSCAFIYSLAKRFFTTIPSLFVVLCYLSYGEIIAHATSFRFDGLAAFLLLASLALLIRRPESSGALVGAGSLAAVALLVTMKSIFYLPGLVLSIVLANGGRRQWRRAAVRTTTFMISLAASGLLLYFLHKSTLSPEVVATGERVSRAGSAFIRLDRLFPALPYFLSTLATNPVIWVVMGLGAFTALRRAVRGESRREQLLLLTLLTPLASLVIYRNAFPYYYVFIMPPAFVLAGSYVEEVLRRSRARTGVPPLLILLIVAVLGNFTIHYVHRFPDRTQVQRQVVEAVHEIFPEPVTYVDRNSMIASFPKAGFFMSTIGFQLYYEGRELIFPGILEREQPKFVLANHPALVLSDTVPIPETPGTLRLFPADFEALRDNFVPHWGPIYVAGKRMHVGQSPTSFEVIIAGVYTLETAEPVTIDGVQHAPGDTVRLGPGTYTAMSTHGEHVLTLRWGSHLRAPRSPPPTEPLYVDF